MDQVRSAIGSGAVLEERDARGFAALHLAAALNRDPQVIKALLSAGANVDAASKDNLTPLTYAAWTNGNPEVLKVLIDAGAALNGIPNPWKRTPLMYAAERNTPEIVKALLAAGADPRLKSQDGKTAYDYAQGNERLRNDAVCGVLDRDRYNDQKAREAYAEGMRAWQSGSYAAAATQLSAATVLLGKASIRIQPPLVRSLFALKEYRRTVQESDVYLALKPDPDSAECAELNVIRKKAQDLLKQDDADFRQAVAQRDESRGRLYLSTYPFGLHTAEIGALLDDLGWERAVRTATCAAYLSYVDSFPSGGHRDAAVSAAQGLDKAGWDQAVSQGSQAGFEGYLRAYPRGAYRSQAAAAVLAFKDDASWSQALSRNSIDSFTAYLAGYPAGRHAGDARTKLSALQEAEKNRKQLLAEAQRAEQKKEYEALAARYRGEAAVNYLLGTAEIAVLVGAGALLYSGYTTDDWTLMAIAAGVAGGCLPIFINLIPRQFQDGAAAAGKAKENKDAAQRLSFSVAPCFTTGPSGLRLNGVSIGCALRP